jgi:uncharacterized phiE125 gp8 family phage protein
MAQPPWSGPGLSCANTLELIDPPAQEPISLAEAKAQLRVDFNDDDGLIARLISTAVAFTDAKGALGKAMITQKWRQFPGTRPTIVRLLINPVQAVLAIRYFDLDGNEQFDDLDNYSVFATNGYTVIQPKPGFTWPEVQDRPDAIGIDYEAGYGDNPSDVPQTVRHALMMLVGHWYEQRENTSEGKPQTVPFGFEELIGIERSCWYG